jgi:hypothetical protein
MLRARQFHVDRDALEVRQLAGAERAADGAGNGHRLRHFR